MPADSQKLMFKKLLCDTDIVGRVIKPGGKVMLLGKSDAGLIKTPVLHEDQRTAASSSLTADAEDAGNVLGRHGELTEMAALNAERVARQDMRDQRHELAAPPRLPEKNAPVRCSKKKNKSKDSGTGVTAASSCENMQQARVGKQKKQADGECSGVDEDDIDALLASLHMTRGITNCGFPKCEAEGVQMMGSTCAHCRFVFEFLRLCTSACLFVCGKAGRCICLPKSLRRRCASLCAVCMRCLHPVCVCVSVCVSVCVCVCSACVLKHGVQASLLHEAPVA